MDAGDDLVSPETISWIRKKLSRKPGLYTQIILRHLSVDALAADVQAKPGHPDRRVPPSSQRFCRWQSEHPHSGGSDGPAGRWLSPITGRIGCGGRVATHDHVVLRNHRVDLNSQIRKHRPQLVTIRLTSSAPRGRKWIAW